MGDTDLHSDAAQGQGIGDDVKDTFRLKVADILTATVIIQEIEKGRRCRTLMLTGYLRLRIFEFEYQKCGGVALVENT